MGSDSKTWYEDALKARQRARKEGNSKMDNVVDAYHRIIDGEGHTIDLTKCTERYVVTYVDRKGNTFARTAVDAQGYIDAICRHEWLAAPCIDKLVMPVSVRVEGLSGGQFINQPVVIVSDEETENANEEAGS